MVRQWCCLSDTYHQFSGQVLCIRNKDRYIWIYCWICVLPKTPLTDSEPSAFMSKEHYHACMYFQNWSIIFVFCQYLYSILVTKSSSGTMTIFLVLFAETCDWHSSKSIFFKGNWYRIAFELFMTFCIEDLSVKVRKSQKQNNLFSFLPNERKYLGNNHTDKYFRSVLGRKMRRHNLECTFFSEIFWPLVEDKHLNFECFFCSHSDFSFEFFSISGFTGRQRQFSWIEYWFEIALMNY